RSPALRARDVGYGNVQAPGIRTTEKNTSPWATRTWPVSAPTCCAGAAPPKILFIPPALHKCRLWETWRALLWARSIENVVEPGGRGLAFVAAPEELPVRERGPAWPLVAVS